MSASDLVSGWVSRSLPGPEAPGLCFPIGIGRAWDVRNVITPEGGLAEFVLPYLSAGKLRSPIPARTTMAQLRLRHPNGVSTIQIDLESATVQDLLQEIHKITEILPSRQDGRSVMFGSS